MFRPASLRPMLWLLFSMLSPTLLLAQEDADKLRKAAQNPVASLISVPLQDNWNFGVGPDDRIQTVLNVQPVIPFSLGKNWNLIVRWISPVVFQPVASAESGGVPGFGVYGLGDMNPSFFVAPKQGKVVWGAGPTFVLPTATNSRYLGQAKFSMGPAAVVLVQPGNWTFGVLWNNVWSVAGPSDRTDVNQMVFQYFVNYNLKRGWYLTWQPTITANWEVEGDGRWNVPIGGGIGRIMKIGPQPVNVGVQCYRNVVHADVASSWSFRAQLTLLFPKNPKG